MILSFDLDPRNGEVVRLDDHRAAPTIAATDPPRAETIRRQQREIADARGIRLPPEFKPAQCDDEEAERRFRVAEDRLRRLREIERREREFREDLADRMTVATERARVEMLATEDGRGMWRGGELLTEEAQAAQQRITLREQEREAFDARREARRFDLAWRWFWRQRAGEMHRDAAEWRERRLAEIAGVRQAAAMT